MSIQFSNLKMYRVKAGMTQEDIAEKLGVSRQAVAKWERGESLPDIESCIELSNLFGTTVDMLVRNMQVQAREGDDGKHVFGISKINEKGQITLPAECRKVFGLKSGDSMLVLGDEDKGIALVNLGNVAPESE
ncbi:MAG: helix-turn-helix domain-containing protein [Ruminiclostridium sp.]|nr:helix-turn-helix domain-containing protein [Ruminiclostridium sp.]